jgi:hypothetical protein
MDEINNEKINFSFTVDQINSILAVLGQAPFVQSANLIGLIQAQGESQFEKLKAKMDELAKEEKADE